MTVTEAPGRTLRELSDDELASAYHTGRLTFDQLEAECARRDAAERRAASVRARQSAWFDTAHAAFLAAESATNGNLLSRAGRRAGVDPISLWRGSEDTAHRYASEELRAFWDANGRVTPGQYARQMAADKRDEAEAYAPRRTRPVARITRPTVAALEDAPRPVLATVAALEASPVVIAAPVPGSIARYTAALGALADYTDAITARVLAAHDLMRKAS